MNNTLVIIPTYNERETLNIAIEKTLLYDEFSVLVVDDNSPDRTYEVAEEWSKRSNRVFLIKREAKLGLGSAYIRGFKWGLERKYEYFIEMDADGSHNPNALPWFLKEIKKGYDVIIGSRYIDGKISVVGWEFRRLLLSKFGNFYASRLLGLPYTDLTSGFRCYSRKALEAINLDLVRSNGYAFQIEMIYWMAKAGLKIGEMPITFYERNTGSSKMSKAIIWEAARLPWKIKLWNIKNFLKIRKSNAETVPY